MAMTYTLAMAGDQGIQIADDGVAEVSMTEARANLTRLVREVRYGSRAGAFTERKQRSAYVVSADFYDQAVQNREVLERLRGFIGLPPGASAEDSPDLLQRSRILHEALTAAGFPLDS